MNKPIKKLIEHLKIQAKKYHWHGYTHTHCRSRKHNGQRLSGLAFYRVCLKTIIPDKLITIQINRVYQAGYWHVNREEFDPQKHFYWYELVITDELKRNGNKTILSLDCMRDEADIAIFQELFDAILKLSIFNDKLIEGSKENAIYQLMAAI